MIHYGIAKTDEDLHEILTLQKRNLAASVSPQEAKEQGFVTVDHDFDLLKRMNLARPHIVAREGGRIVGYALVMLRSFANEIPVLIPMFLRINQLTYQRIALQDSKYFVMGQVCIDKNYRGKGIFGGLYTEMSKRMAVDFDLIVTEVASKNTRSIKAHHKVGFETILKYKDSEEWEVVILKI